MSGTVAAAVLAEKLFGPDHTKVMFAPAPVSMSKSSPAQMGRLAVKFTSGSGLTVAVAVAVAGQLPFAGVAVKVTT